MIGYPLDSHVTYKADGTPVFDRAISSAPLRKLTKKLFSDGVLPNPSTNMQVTAVSGATVKVLNGFALCNGCMKLQETDLEIILPTSDASLDRIDTVVLRLDDNDDVRACEFYVVSGAAASTPQAPALTKTDSIYELGLANIYRKANSTEVTNANITDTRYDSARCGIISSISEFDTTTLYQQIEADLREFKTINEAEFEAWFTTLKDVLSGDVAGELYNLINEVKGNVGNLEELKTSNKEDIVSAVNEVKDGLDNAKVDTLTTLEQVEATTDNTIPVGAGAVKQLNDSLGGISFITEEGKGITGYTLTGADTVYPFSSGIKDFAVSYSNMADSPNGTFTFEVGDILLVLYIKQVTSKVPVLGITSGATIIKDQIKCGQGSTAMLVKVTDTTVKFNRSNVDYSGQYICFNLSQN